MPPSTGRRCGMPLHSLAPRALLLQVFNHTKARHAKCAPGATAARQCIAAPHRIAIALRTITPHTRQPAPSTSEKNGHPALSAEALTAHFKAPAAPVPLMSGLSISSHQRQLGAGTRGTLDPPPLQGGARTARAPSNSSRRAAPKYRGYSSSAKISTAALMLPPTHIRGLVLALLREPLARLLRRAGDWCELERSARARLAQQRLCARVCSRQGASFADAPNSIPQTLPRSRGGRWGGCTRPGQ
ncbi:hypothetical protein B0H21DRAFT_894370 [Amylocystis lapponica]|nr:hypothetical protein B0H21DRAFT_894370 [Amylocystis lapponica]